MTKMKEIYLQTDKESCLFDNNIEMFKYLQKNEYIIKNVQDGVIEAECKGEKKTLQFGKIETFDSKLDLIKEIQKHQENIKPALNTLIECGIDLTAEQKILLIDSYSFLESNK